MKVKRYRLGDHDLDGPSAPRVWRISTLEGVFWLVEGGMAARLIRLPVHSVDGARAPVPAAEPWPALIELASIAEAEAAGRWVRVGQLSPAARGTADVADDPS